LLRTLESIPHIGKQRGEHKKIFEIFCAGNSVNFLASASRTFFRKLSLVLRKKEKEKKKKTAV